VSTPADWLPPVPSHWAIAPLGFRYEVQLGKMLNPDAAGGDDPAPYLRNTDVQWGRINTDDLPVMSFDVRERTKFALRPGDLLVCEGGDVGRAAIWNGELAECFYQKALHRVRPWLNTEIPKFLYYVLAAASWRGAFLAEGNRSTIVHLPAEKLRAMRFPFPPRAEQHAIADFLDRKMAPIDAFIAKKELMIEALTEKRHAMLTQLVTEGLDPRTPMKPSGIEWLSRVPSHWRIDRMRLLYSERALSPRAGDGVVTAFRDGQVALRDRRRSEGFMFAEKEVGYQHVCRGDLVVHSMDAFAGAIGVSEDDGKCTPEYLVLAPLRNETSNTYYASLLRVMARRGFILVSCPSVRERAPRLRFYALRDMFVPVPPPAEQHAIEKSLGELDASLLPASESLVRSLEPLREYRQALITAAVTGQLDVATQEAA